MIDLSLVSEEEMWEELKKRNTSVILITLKGYDDNREAVAVSYCGSKFMCIGLAEHCVSKIMQDSLDEEGLEGDA